MSDYQLRMQPGFCPVCGAHFKVLSAVRTHLVTSHGLGRRAALAPFAIVWREAWVALAGITEPGPGWGLP